MLASAVHHKYCKIWKCAHCYSSLLIPNCFPMCLLKEHIMEIFSTYGKIKMIDMPMNRVHPHLSKGYAYVEFETPEEAEKALKHMDGGECMWRNMNSKE